MHTSECIGILYPFHKPVTLKLVQDQSKVSARYSGGLFQFRNGKGVMGESYDYSDLSFASE
jgi:hypothetical protein